MGQCCNNAAETPTENLVTAMETATPPPPPAVKETAPPPPPPAVKETPTSAVKEAPTPAVKETAPTPPATAKCQIEFLANGQKTVVEATESPIGLTFMPNKTPLVVKTVTAGGHAEKLGVKEGWQFVKIGDKNIASVPYGDALKILVDAMKQLPKDEATWVPPGSLEMVFTTPTCLSKKVAFSKKPFGMVFDSKMPIVIKRVVPGGEAERLGVQVGWTLTELSRKDCSKMDISTVNNMIKTASDVLPSSS